MEVINTHTFGLAIAFLVAIAALVMAWSKQFIIGKPNIERLRSYAHGLKLQIHNIEGSSLFEAIADQLSHLNCHGSYTPDIIRNKTKGNISLSFWQNVKGHLTFRKEQEVWKSHAIMLHEIADAYNRTIEVVHYDRKETTVIRPAGTEVTRHLQTVYIGYGGQGHFFSLRPLDANRTAGIRPEANHPDTSKSKATNNVLIGDNTKQYVIHLPTGDNDDDYSITKNIVVGDNTSQYIIATFRTSKELIAVLREMESTGTEGSEHRLKLKIRERSETLSDEQLTEKHKRTIALLEDKDSEPRRKLEEALEPLGVIYEKSSLECILLHLKLDSVAKGCEFVTQFQAGDLDNIMKVIACPLYHNNTSTYDIQLQFSLTLSVTESEKLRPYLHCQVVRNSSEKKTESVENPVEKETTNLKADSTNQGISIVLRQKPDHKISETVSAGDLATKIPEVTFRSLTKSHLLEYSSDIDIHFEKYGSLNTTYFSKRSSREIALQNASNMISESTRGYVGSILIGRNRAGTCFRVGKRYVMTAYHVIAKVIENRPVEDHLENIYVEFPDVEEKHLAKPCFHDKCIDFSVLELASENTEMKPLKLVVDCYPGFPFYTICNIKSSRKIRRSVIASTDYTTKSTPSEWILFESDNFKYGCSGAPGIAIIDGKVCMVTMLLGTIVTDANAWYYGVKMTEVYKRMSEKHPDIADEIFASFKDHSFQNESTDVMKNTPTRNNSQNSVPMLGRRKKLTYKHKIIAIANKLKCLFL